VWTFHGQHVRLLRSSELDWNQAGCFSCIFTKVFVKYQIAEYDRFCLLFISERLITFFADSKIIKISAVEDK